jgi:hypothetical protein
MDDLDLDWSRPSRPPTLIVDQKKETQSKKCICYDKNIERFVLKEVFVWKRGGNKVQ